MHHFLGWIERGKISPLKSPTFSCIERNQYYLGQILVKRTANSTNYDIYFRKCTEKYKK